MKLARYGSKPAHRFNENHGIPKRTVSGRIFATTGITPDAGRVLSPSPQTRAAHGRIFDVTPQGPDVVVSSVLPNDPTGTGIRKHTSRIRDRRTHMVVTVAPIIGDLWHPRPFNRRSTNQFITGVAETTVADSLIRAPPSLHHNTEAGTRESVQRMRHRSRQLPAVRRLRLRYQAPFQRFTEILDSTFTRRCSRSGKLELPHSHHAPTLYVTAVNAANVCSHKTTPRKARSAPALLPLT